MVSRCVCVFRLPQGNTNKNSIAHASKEPDREGGGWSCFMHNRNHRRSHPEDAGTERVGFSPTRQTSRAPSAKRCESFGESHRVGRGLPKPFYFFCKPSVIFSIRTEITTLFFFFFFNSFRRMAPFSLFGASLGITLAREVSIVGNKKNISGY